MADKIKNIWKRFDSKKTYILSVAALVLAALLQFNMIDQATYENILKLLAPLGFIALRAGVKKSTN